MAGFSLEFCCCYGPNLRHTFSITAIYSPLGEYLGTIIKLEPLAIFEFCASMSGMEDRFLTHLAGLMYLD